MNALKIFGKGTAAFFLLAVLTVASMAQNLTNTGSWANTGTLKVVNLTNSGASAAFTNSGSSSLLRIGGTLTTNASGALPANFDVTAGAVHYYGAAQSITDQVKSNTYNKLAGYGTGTKTLAGSITVADSLTADSVTVTVGSNTLTLTSASGGTDPLKTQHSGSLTLTGGTVNYAGGAQNVFNSTYGTLGVTASGNKTLQGNVDVNSNLNLAAGQLQINGKVLTLSNSTISTTSGTLAGGSTSAITFSGSGSTTLPSVASGLDTLTVNRSGATISLAASSTLTVNSQLTLSAGTLAIGSDSLAIMKTVSGAGSLTSAANGSAYYGQGSGGQSVFASNYGNLYFSNFGKTLPGSTVGIAGNFDGGSATTHTVAGNTLAFNGGTQTVPSFNGATGYNNLTLSGDVTTKTASGNVTVGGSLVNGTSTDSVTFVVGTNGLTAPTRSQTTRSLATFSGNSNGVVFSTGWVGYNGTTVSAPAGQTIALGSYANLVFSNNAQKNVTAGTVSTSANLAVNSGVALDVSGSGVLAVAGDLTNSGIITNAGVITVGP